MALLGFGAIATTAIAGPSNSDTAVLSIAGSATVSFVGSSDAFATFAMSGSATVSFFGIQEFPKYLTSARTGRTPRIGGFNTGAPTIAARAGSVRTISGS